MLVNTMPPFRAICSADEVGPFQLASKTIVGALVGYGEDGTRLVAYPRHDTECRDLMAVKVVRSQNVKVLYDKKFKWPRLTAEPATQQMPAMELDTEATQEAHMTGALRQVWVECSHCGKWRPCHPNH
eukprot:Lankesteria_metandrocarpae@DN5069_c0_g1_i1.p1